MIRLVSNDIYSGDKVYSLFSDTKNEVPSTGSATLPLVEGFKGSKLLPGSILYTAKLEIAVLKSDDTWEWGA